jgi:hypothetical protein
MGLPNEINPLLVSTTAGYQIERSLRFNSADSAYLNRTPASTGTSRRVFTISLWLKRSALLASALDFGFINAGGDGTTIGISGTGAFGSGLNNTVFVRNGGSNVGNWPAVFRDTSAWYHFVVAIDSTQATAANRQKLYVNGVDQGACSGSLTQNVDTAVNHTGLHLIGAFNGPSAGYYANGYLTEYHLIDGQALTPSSFGEYDTITGVWKPKKYAGTYGTNGFYLKFADNSGTTSTTLGKDSSDNGNNWTPNNFSVTAGAGNDSMIDTPTPYADGGNGRGNYATLNPLDANGGTISNGNLEYSGIFASGVSQNGHGTRSTLKVPSSGKWYTEAANTTISGSGNSCMLGFTSSTQLPTVTAFGGTLTPWIGVDASVFNNRILLQWVGVSGGTAAATQLFASYASGDIVNFAIDFGAGKFWVGKNGTWYNSGDPAAGTNPTSTFTAGTADWAFWGEYIASSDNVNRSGVISNFGQRPFAYTPPSGFKALNTGNLPEPSIKKPSSYFDTKLYTGTGSAQSITGLGFSPDLVWAKVRSTAGNHSLYDNVRGATQRLSSSTTSAEATFTGSLTSFDSGGFSLGSNSDGDVNASGSTYVAWCWDESATPGFDIVTYTGTGSNTTVAHSLGVAPSMIIYKRRSATDSWIVYHTSIGTANNLVLNNTNAQAANGSVYWNSTAPTSTVFSVGTDSAVNASASTYVAYLWSEVAGFSKFGSYTGNGNADGPFVFCGFRPRFILFKNTTGFNWQILDTARADYNQGTVTLFPNLSNAENTTATQYDILSNGFKIRTSDAGSNGSGNSIIFAAFAEAPFKYSLAR